MDLKQLDEDYQQYNQAFHNLINEHPLLASYSNIFVIVSAINHNNIVILRTERTKQIHRGDNILMEDLYQSY